MVIGNTIMQFFFGMSNNDDRQIMFINVIKCSYKEKKVINEENEIDGLRINKWWAFKK